MREWISLLAVFFLEATMISPASVGLVHDSEPVIASVAGRQLGDLPNMIQPPLSGVVNAASAVRQALVVLPVPAGANCQPGASIVPRPRLRVPFGLPVRERWW